MHLNTSKLQTQKPLFTASLEKSIAILLLPHKEVACSIDQELQNNPLLEAEFEASPEPHDVQESPPDLKRMDALINLSSSHISKSFVQENQDFESSSMVNMMTLEDHLFQQLYWDISDPLKREIGNFIIGNLDKEGFLHLSCEEIAETLNISDGSLVKEVLNTIQNFDPLGIAAKNIQECLVIQLQSRQSPHRDLAIRIVGEYLDDLGNKRYSALAKKCGVSPETINKAEVLIASLEPKPARNYRPIDPSIYIEPDIYIRKNEQGQYTVETNKNGLPVLKVSQVYRNLLNQPNLSEQDRNFIKEKINNAMAFIKNLHQRGDTLTAIGRFILNHQKEFFDEEDSSLAPLALKDAAIHLERSESTISRAISNKYIDTPKGLFPLKFFFSHNATRHSDKNVSAHSIKQELAQLIEDENKASPLSDQDIQAYFDAKGLRLARRTIAKYRQKMHIPSSHQRNK